MHDLSKPAPKLASPKLRVAVGALAGLLFFAAGEAISMDPEDSDDEMDDLGLPYVPEGLLGKLPKICSKTQVAIIGKVSSVVQNSGAPISSQVSFQVERVLKGSVGPTVTTYMPVGMLNGHWVTIGAFPHVEEDQRYLLLLADRNGQATGLTVLDIGHGAVFLDPDATLPSNTVLQQAWNFHCPPPGGP